MLACQLQTLHANMLRPMISQACGTRTPLPSTPSFRNRLRKAPNPVVLGLPSRVMSAPRASTRSCGAVIRTSLQPFQGGQESQRTKDLQAVVVHLGQAEASPKPLAWWLWVTVPGEKHGYCEGFKA